MATLGNAGRVGLVAVVAVLLFGGMWVFLKGGLANNNTYAFDVQFADAHGVTTDTPVTLAGVQVGKVEKVGLVGQRAVLRLRVRDQINGQPFRVAKDSKFLIVTPLLGATGTVTILPPINPSLTQHGDIQDGEADLIGEKTADFNASFARANDLLTQLTETSKRADKLIDAATGLASDPKLQGGLSQTVSNINAASSNGLKLTNTLNGLLLSDNAQLVTLLNQTKSGSQVALGNIEQTTSAIRDTTLENRGQIAGIVRNLTDTTAAVAGLTQQANQALKGGAGENLRATVANIKVTTDNLAATTAKFNAIAGSFQTLSGDPVVQRNLRETLQNIRDSSEQTTFLLERLNKLAGGRRKTAAVVIPGGPAIIVPGGGAGGGMGGGVKPPVTPAPERGAPLFLPRVDLVVNTRQSHFRTDVDAIVPLSLAPVTFIRGGIYGVADNSRLILEGGQGIGRGGLFDARAGLYASKLAVGGDYGLGRPVTLSFDVYDPNKYHLDARGTLMLAPEIGLILGGEDITRRSGALIGLEYRQSK